MAFLAVGVAAHAGFSFTFDTGSQGWTKGDLSNLVDLQVNVAGPANWDSAGFLRGYDHASYAFLFSPDLGGGHGSLFGQNLTLDFQSNGAQAKIPFLVLQSSTDTLVLEKAIPASAGLLPYSISLSASEDWSINSSDYHGTAVLATNAQIQAVLNDLRFVGVTTDLASGSDSTMLDNVNAVPEPGTLAALALGVLAARRRRREPNAAGRASVDRVLPRLR